MQAMTSPGRCAEFITASVMLMVLAGCLFPLAYSKLKFPKCIFGIWWTVILDVLPLKVVGSGGGNCEGDGKGHCGGQVQFSTLEAWLLQTSL